MIIELRQFSVFNQPDRLDNRVEPFKPVFFVTYLVALGQEKEDVFEFGVFTKAHEPLIDFLHAHGIETIPMKGTGSYWQTLFFALQEAGFEVILVSGH